MDYDASFSSVPWIIDEFSNMWEDAYGECSGDAEGGCLGWGLFHALTRAVLRSPFSVLRSALSDRLAPAYGMRVC